MTSVDENLYVYIHDNPSRKSWKAQINRQGFLDAASEIKLAGDADKLKVATMLAMRIEDIANCKSGSEEEKALLEGNLENDVPGLFHLGALHAGTTESTFDQAINGPAESHYIVVRYETASDIHLRSALLPPEANTLPGIMSRETLLSALNSLEDADREYLRTIDALT